MSSSPDLRGIHWLQKLPPSVVAPMAWFCNSAGLYFPLNYEYKVMD